MPPGPRIDVTLTPDAASIGQIITVRGDSRLLGPQVTLWLQSINHNLNPDGDSVLLATLAVIDGRFSYDFRLQPQMGPSQVGQQISIRSGNVYCIVVSTANHMIGLALTVHS